MSHLAIKNWNQFQHYRDRDPVWIKVYSRLLDDAAFLALPEAAQAQLVKLWLLASRCRNRILDDATFLSHALHTRRLQVDRLIAAGFVERIASDVLADGYQPASPHARPRARGEGETETERERTTPPTPASASARDAFLAGMPEDRRAGWRAVLDGWPEGLGTPGGRPFAVEQINAGLAEYLANVPEPRDYAVRHVVRYVEGAARTAREGSPARRGGGSFLDLIPGGAA